MKYPDSRATMTSKATATCLVMTLLLFAAIPSGGCDPTTTGPFGQGEEVQGTAGSGQWVIIMAEFDSPTRHLDARTLQDYLVQNEWEGVGLMHDAEQRISFVYYGPFSYSKSDLERRLKAVHEWQDRRRGGIRPFTGAYMKELPVPDPAAPAEWNLANAPRSAFWSLQVGYYVDPGPAFPTTQLMDLPKGWTRKQAAVDACRELREKGFEAFYHHGKISSQLTVGLFPAEAIRQVRNARGEVIGYENYDPVADVFHDPQVHALRNTKVDGKEIFKFNLENGAIIYQAQRLPDERVIRRARPSFLVQVPRREEDVFGLR